MKKIRRQIILFLMKVFGKDTENFAPHGVPVHIPSDADLAIRHLLARGRPYEEPEASFISRYLSEGSNVIELGGCFGIVSALIRHKIGSESRLIVVEAHPELAVICEANATRNAKDADTEVIQAAVDYSGQPSITFASGQNAHVGHVAQEGEAGFTVPTIKLAALAERFSDGQFVLVCDIEGAEIALVENEADTLARVSLLVLETHPALYPQGAADLDAMCASLEGLGLHQVEKIEDVLCFRRAA